MAVKVEFLERIRHLTIDELRVLTKVAKNRKLEAVNEELQKRKEAASLESIEKADRLADKMRAQDRTTAIHIAIFSALSAIFVGLITWLLNR